MKVTYRGKTTQITGVKSVRELIKKMELNPETVLIIKEDELVTEDTRLEETDELKLINVISGG
jgi:sulfur carrier protein